MEGKEGSGKPPASAKQTPDKKGSGVYALGFDDPTGLQSQASTVLAPALTLLSGSGAAELHSILDSTKPMGSEEGSIPSVATPQKSFHQNVQNRQSGLNKEALDRWQATSEGSKVQRLSPPKHQPSTSAVKKARQFLRRGRRRSWQRRSSMDDSVTISMDGSAAGSMDGTLHREISAVSAGSVFDLVNRRDLRPSWQTKAAGHLDSLHVTAFVTFATFLALFMDDTRLAILPTSLDWPCQYISGVVMAIFGIETILGSLLRQGYFLRFFFWIDFVATLSMALDMTAITNTLTKNADGPGSGVGLPTLTRGTVSGWVSRLRSITKVTRILRLMRLVQLYGRYQAAKENAEMAANSGMRTSLKAWWMPSRVSERSRVGQKLFDITARRVIVGILTLLLVIPVFNVYSGLYGEYAALTKGGLQMVHHVSLQEGDTITLDDVNGVYANQAIYDLVKKPTSNIVNLVVGNLTFVDDPSGVALRTVELSTDRVDSAACSSGDYTHCLVSIAVFNIKWYSQFNAILNLVRTSFIVFALGYGVIVLNKDANRLVLRPIERMLRKVKDVSENPLAGRANSRIKVNVDGDALMETRILENSLTKICSLLAVGFGDAGAEVIGDNIKSGGDLNPMVPGHRVTAVFGFCDIRNFTDATEVLQEDVMEFVNSIAKIVHMEVSLHGGSPNKNIGDAFLLVWKLPKGYTSKDIPRSKSNILPLRPSAGNESSKLAVGTPQPNHSAPLNLEDRQGSLAESLDGIMSFGSNDVAKTPVRRKSILKQSMPLPQHGPLSGNKVAPMPIWPADVTRPKDADSHGGKLDSHGGKQQRRLSLKSRNGSDAESQVTPPNDDKEARLYVVQDLADKALSSFVIIQAALKRSRRLSVFARREDLNKRMPNFQVRMGFGLHVGWAIEGAIGSEYKIDASYLSPNVNMASRLEAATKQFGTTILLSEDFVNMLSPFVRQRVRQIDCVTVKGSQRPMGLFTYDVTLEHVSMPDTDSTPATPQQRRSWVAESLGRMESVNEQQSSQEVQTFSLSTYDNEFLQHPDLVSTWAVDLPFLARFAEGFAAYRAGNWDSAKDILEETRKMRRTAEGRKVLDGPSCTLLDYMRTHGFEAPSTWQGYRELTEK